MKITYKTKKVIKMIIIQKIVNKKMKKIIHKKVPQNHKIKDKNLLIVTRIKCNKVLRL